MTIYIAKLHYGINNKNSKILQVIELASYLEGTSRLSSMQDVHMVHTPKTKIKITITKFSSNVHYFLAFR